MKILWIDACICAHSESRTRFLCSKYFQQLKCEDGITERVVLEDLPIAPLTKTMLKKRDFLIKTGQYQNEIFALARQFREADMIVVSAPYWDLSFPSILKVYVEHIMVNGLTFRYTETGPEGLCRAATLTYITTAGGYVGNRNFGFEYIKAIAEMLGIREVSFICAEGLDIAGAEVSQILHDTLICLSEDRTIPYPKSYQECLREEGASAFAGVTDHAGSRYYTANDYYNWNSGGTLHILSHFETYQQTTEYTCGAACALMVLNWFNAKRYHGRLVEQLIECKPGKAARWKILQIFST